MKNIFCLVFLLLFLVEFTNAGDIRMYDPRVPLEDDEAVIMGRVLIRRKSQESAGDYRYFNVFDVRAWLSCKVSSGSKQKSLSVNAYSIQGKANEYSTGELDKQLKKGNYDNLLKNDSYFFYVVPAGLININYWGFAEGSFTYGDNIKDLKLETLIAPKSFNYLGTIIIDYTKHYSKWEGTSLMAKVEISNDFNLLKERYKIRYSNYIKELPKIIIASYLPQDINQPPESTCMPKRILKCNDSYLKKPVESKDGNIYISSVDKILTIDQNFKIDTFIKLDIKKTFSSEFLTKNILKHIKSPGIVFNSDGTKIYYITGNRQINLLDINTQKSFSVIAKYAQTAPIPKSTLNFESNRLFLEYPVNYYHLACYDEELNFKYLLKNVSTNYCIINDTLYSANRMTLTASNLEDGIQLWNKSEYNDNYDTLKMKNCRELIKMGNSMIIQRYLKSEIIYLIMDTGGNIINTISIPVGSKINDRYSLKVDQINNKIYIVSSSGYIYCYNWHYELEWMFKANDIIDYDPAIAPDGKVYFTCNDMYLYCLNPKGKLLWKYYTDTPLMSTPTIANDGTVYIGTGYGYLYAFE